MKIDIPAERETHKVPQTYHNMFITFYTPFYIIASHTTCYATYLLYTVYVYHYLLKFWDRHVSQKSSRWNKTWNSSHTWNMQALAPTNTPASDQLRRCCSPLWAAPPMLKRQGLGDFLVRLMPMAEEHQLSMSTSVPQWPLLLLFARWWLRWLCLSGSKWTLGHYGLRTAKSWTQMRTHRPGNRDSQVLVIAQRSAKCTEQVPLQRPSKRRKLVVEALFRTLSFTWTRHLSLVTCISRCFRIQSKLHESWFK